MAMCYMLFSLLSVGNANLYFLYSAVLVVANSIYLSHILYTALPS